MLKTVFTIAALVFFGLVTFGVPGRVNWMGAGLFCLTVALLLV